VYNLVRRNPALKQLVRNLYQGAFDLLPLQKEFFRGAYQMKENFFFGFHDISPFSSDEKKLLANHVSFDLRMPEPEESLEVGYFEFAEGRIGLFHTIGNSFSWNYHKGCRLQWIDTNRAIFNSAENSKLIARIIDTHTREEKKMDYPIDSVYSDANRCLATSFSYERLERCMPGYGYPYKDNGFTEQSAPAGTGLFIVNLKENTRKLLVPIAELAETVESCYSDDFLHFVTHSEFSPDGRYVSFLHRWIHRTGDALKRWTRIVVYDLKLDNLIVLPSQESGSHYVWNHKNQLIASCIIGGNSRHVLFDMNNLDNCKIIAGNRINSDGHQSFISDTSFVTDTYPDKHRMAKIYKVNTVTSDVELMAKIYSPKTFQTKDFRRHIACDLHPRVSPSGKYICFDSPRTGIRSLYIMNLNI
jgi:hypothetical protein